MRNIPNPSRTPSFHRQGLSITFLDSNLLQYWTLAQRKEAHVVLGHAEINDAKPRGSALVDRWLDHTVNRGLVEPSGQEVDGVTRIDDLHETH